MKTTKPFKTFPNGIKILLYVSAVTVLCFLSVILPRSIVNNTRTSKADKEIIMFTDMDESEASLEVETWMFDFNAADLDKAFHTPEYLFSPFRRVLY